MRAGKIVSADNSKSFSAFKELKDTQIRVDQQEFANWDGTVAKVL